MAQATKVTVTVTYETEYDGEVTEDEIDVHDIIQDTDTIKDIKIKTKSYLTKSTPLIMLQEFMRNNNLVGRIE